MKVLVIVANPSLGSFNHAIAEASVETLGQNGHEVFYHDLYQENFTPILPHSEISKNAPIDLEIQRHCEEIASSDGIIIVHPNWWGQPPAILKGWVDRVIRPGVAYEFLEGDSGEGVPIGLLKARTAIVFNTSNTPIERELRVFGDPLETFWKNCIFGLCGIKDFHRVNFSIVVTSTIEQRIPWLENVKDTVNRYFPEQNNQFK